MYRFWRHLKLLKGFALTIFTQKIVGALPQVEQFVWLIPTTNSDILTRYWTPMQTDSNFLQGHVVFMHIRLSNNRSHAMNVQGCTCTALSGSACPCTSLRGIPNPMNGGGRTDQNINSIDTNACIDTCVIGLILCFYPLSLVDSPLNRGIDLKPFLSTSPFPRWGWYLSCGRQIHCCSWYQILWRGSHFYPQPMFPEKGRNTVRHPNLGV